MLSRIPGMQEDLAFLRSVAPSGFVIALNLGWAGPELLHTEFPDEWREIYEEKGYFMRDPVFYWTVLHTGHRRWSEVGLPDPWGVSEKARKYGLNYGAVICRKVNGKKSFISVGRADRELDEAEFKAVIARFDRWLDYIADRPDLSIGEMQVLKSIREGASQSETAAQLGIAESTVKKRAQSAMKKLNASTRAEAVSIAVERQYFTLD